LAMLDIPLAMAFSALIGQHFDELTRRSATAKRSLTFARMCAGF
jgi:hypothetical protein